MEDYTEQEKINLLQTMVNIHRAYEEQNEYSLGFTNGLIHALAVMQNEEPQYKRNVHWE